MPRKYVTNAEDLAKRNLPTTYDCAGGTSKYLYSLPREVST